MNAAVQQPEPAAPAEPKAEPAAPAEPKPEPAPPAEPKPEPTAPAEPKTEKQDSSAAEIADLKGKVHALSVGAKPDTLSDLLTLENIQLRQLLERSNISQAELARGQAFDRRRYATSATTMLRFLAGSPRKSMRFFAYSNFRPC